MNSIFQKCWFISGLFTLIVLLFGGISEAELAIHKISVSPPKTEIMLGSGKIVLTVKASGGKNLTFQWELNGFGKLEEPTTKSAVFYIPPDRINGESEQVKISVKVMADGGQEATDNVLLVLRNIEVISETPIKTPKPSDSSQEEGTGVSPIVPNTTVTFSDGFDNVALEDNWIVNQGKNTKISSSNGIIRISAKRADGAWAGLLRQSWSIGKNQGSVILFRYYKGVAAPFYLETGTWETKGYRRLGIGINEDPEDSAKTQWEGWEGTSGKGFFSASLKLYPERWYYLMVTVGEDGDVKAKLWEKDNPGQQKEFQSKHKWAGYLWRFCATTNEGTIEIDEYQEFTF